MAESAGRNDGRPGPTLSPEVHPRPSGMDSNPHDTVMLQKRNTEPFPNGGEMGHRLRTKDWSTTPFDRIETWPQSLKTATAIMLESSFAMVVAWGPDFRFLYNDRYIPVLGFKHPNALGTPAREIFPEVWEDILRPLFMRTRQGKPSRSTIS